MPANDRYQDAVVRALVKDGWSTEEQFTLSIGQERWLWVDIRATKEAQSLVILVEVKGFEKMRSPVNYLADAVGKYVLYVAILKYLRMDVPLYMAVPRAAYAGIFNEIIGQAVIKEANIRLIVFDPEKEEIYRWIV